MIILENKQVGDVSYMVSELSVLYNILNTESIYSSRNTEYNPNTGKKQNYVSLSRDLTSAAFRNSKRWVYGVLLDGDKLSDNYSITPYSYSGTVLNSGGDLRVKYIAEYDDGTCVLNLVNWSTMSITKSIYDEIVSAIEKMPNDLKIKKKLEHTMEGKNRRNGKVLKEKYLFNVKTGGLRITQKEFPSLCSKLSKSSGMNETEERIWLNNENTISIKRCIKGIIIPKKMSSEEDVELENILKMLDDKNISISIIKY